MKSGKRSYPSWDQVSDLIGDKVISGVGLSVANMKADLDAYRKTFPGWVAQSTERGLAGWLHDRMWYHLVAAVDDHPDLTIADKEPLREIVVGPVSNVCRFRIKRQHLDGKVSTYPTPLALEFLAQKPPMLGIFSEIHLIAGYRWDKELRRAGVPLISLRDGRHIIWEKEIDLPGATASPERLPIVPVPSVPVIEIPAKDQQQSDNSSE